MSFNINLSGHITGETEAAKAFEQKIVADLEAFITEVRDFGHTVSGSFHGQHTGTVVLAPPVDPTPPVPGVQVAPSTDSPVPTGEGDAPAAETPAP